MDIAILFSIATLLLAAVLTHWAPLLTRPELFFGVTVRPDFRESSEARRLIRLFQLQVWAHTAVAAMIVVAARSSNASVVSGAAIWWLIAGSSLAWYIVNRRARPYAVAPSSEREAVITAQDMRLPGNWLVKAGPFLILAATALYLYVNYDQLPDPYPVHWSIAGQPDRAVAKTLKGVLLLPAFGGFVCALLAGIAFSVARSSRRIALSGAAGRRESRFRGLNFGILLGAEYYIAFIHAWLAVAYQLPGALPFAHYVLLVMTFLPIPVVLYLTFRYGQGGSRLGDLAAEPLSLNATNGDPRGENGSAAPIGDRTADDCWKFGMVYYNPDDPALWIEKRAGIGYTLNFGRPLSWVFLAALLFGPFILPRIFGT